MPDVLGGSVEALLMALIRQNEQRGGIRLTMFSAANPAAERIARGYRHTRLVYVRTPRIIRALDRVIYWSAGHLLRRRELVAYRYRVQVRWYTAVVSHHLARHRYDKLVIENHTELFRVLKRHGNGRRYRGRVYYHLHNEVKGDSGCRAQILHVRRVIAASRFLNCSLNRHLAGRLNAEQLAVFRNCVGSQAFGSQAVEKAGRALRARYHIMPRDVVILFAGRVNRNKGALETLRAFDRARIPGARLVIAGGNYYGTDVRSDYERLLRRVAAPLGDRVIFTGHVAYDRMPAVYAMADLCCMPSVWDEPAGLTMIEAMSAGRALITTRSGGIPEYVDHTCAVLLDRGPGLVGKLARAMTDLAANAARRDAMGKSGRRTAAAFTPQRYYENFLQLLRG